MGHTAQSVSPLLALAGDHSLIGRVIEIDRMGYTFRGRINDIAIESDSVLLLTISERVNLKVINEKSYWMQGFSGSETYSAPDDGGTVVRTVFPRIGTNTDHGGSSIRITVRGGWSGTILPDGTVHPPANLRKLWS